MLKHDLCRKDIIKIDPERYVFTVVRAADLQRQHITIEQQPSFGAVTTARGPVWTSPGRCSFDPVSGEMTMLTT
jgi:hypothetical protein